MVKLKISDKKKNIFTVISLLLFLQQGPQNFVNEIKIKKLTQGLNSKKATGIDTIP